MHQLYRARTLTGNRIPIRFASGLLLSILIFTAAAAQTTRYVSTTGITAAAAATSWATSTTDLQGAINASAPGDRVWVATGIYKPTSTTARDISFVMQPGVAIYGGFRGVESNLNERPNVNPLSGTPSSSTLSGDLQGDDGPGFTNRNDNSFHVVFNDKNNLTNTAVLNGFVITGGNANSFSTYPHNIGGGIFNFQSSPQIINCLLQENSAHYGGGGLYDAICGPNLTNCSFQSNTAGTNGGAIYNDTKCSPIVTNCSFSGNVARNGGAINSISIFGSFLITNCSFQGNIATTSGGAIYHEGVGISELTNCVLFANGTNSIFPSTDQITVNYSLFGQAETRYTGSNNLITTTSPFIGTASVALAPCSPAINAGNPASVTVASGPYSATALPATDLAGNARIAYGRIDMGAVEYQNQNWASLGIVRQPDAGSAICAGSSLVISVTAAGSSPAYQWYKDGTALTGVASATTANLSLVNVQSADAGSYSVVITGDCPAAVTSTAFSLTVNALPSLAITATPSTTLSCLNPSLTLTATSSATALLWSTTETTTSITVSTTGVYSVTATGTNGCTTASNSLTISQDKTSPAVSVSALNSILTCTQPQLTLTATSSSTALRWSTGETTTSITVSTTGVYSVTATGTNGCTAASNSLTISQDKTSPAVSVSTLNSILTCAQPQLTLTATSSATALRWSTNETTTSITVSTTGVYSVTATGTNGCTAASNNLTISQDKAAPAVSLSAGGNNTTLTCAQPQPTLTATSSATALRWSTTETTTSITVSTTGVYSVTATATNGCTAVSNSLTISQNFSLPPFTVTSATVCTGQITSLSAIGCSGTVQWSNNASGAVIILTAGSSTSVLTATCTVGSCSTTASGQLSVGGILPPPAQILSFTADESACPVRLTGRGVASSFTMTGPGNYIFSTVFREGSMREATGLNVNQSGTYTLTATYTNSCGTSAPVTRSVTVERSCP